MYTKRGFVETYGFCGLYRAGPPSLYYTNSQPELLVALLCQLGLLICMFTRTTIHQTSIEFSILRKTWYQMVLTCLLPTLLMQPCCCWCFACCGLHSSIICRCLCIRTFGIGSSQIFHKKKREREEITYLAPEQQISYLP